MSIHCIHLKFRHTSKKNSCVYKFTQKQNTLILSQKIENNFRFFFLSVHIKFTALIPEVKIVFSKPNFKHKKNILRYHLQ